MALYADICSLEPSSFLYALWNASLDNRVSGFYGTLRQVFDSRLKTIGGDARTQELIHGNPGSETMSYFGWEMVAGVPRPQRIMFSAEHSSGDRECMVNLAMEPSAISWLIWTRSD